MARPANHSRGSPPRTWGRRRPQNSAPEMPDGSPPRTWGRRVAAAGRVDRRRFTPTHVGKTSLPWSDPCAASVHPHARGEDALTGDIIAEVAVHPHARGEDRMPVCRTSRRHGSPPRTWGRRRRSALAAPLGGSPPRTWGRPGHPGWDEVYDRFTPTHVGKTGCRCAELRGATVHPHARGEDDVRFWHDRQQARFTPTHVGKTWVPIIAAPASPVHPHARGEDVFPARLCAVHSGSPPRTWGRLDCSAARLPSESVHPHARGEDGSWGLHHGAAAVHPHARGEDFASRGGKVGVSGSPPRTWGRRPAGVVQGNDGRFTPTHVGKTPCSPLQTAPPSVHPHARGEDSSRWAKRRPVTGSPPRTWGRRQAGVLSAAGSRFTPTHVGKTSGEREDSTGVAVHPHARGEDGCNSFHAAFACGSPPRTWGRRGDRQHEVGPRRFTPTHVGKTPTPRLRGGARSVHPHARGEDYFAGHFYPTAIGSPPRTWGRPDHQRGGAVCRRFTPTHVGKTVWR